MKRITTILIACLILISCSKENPSELELEVLNATTSLKTYVLNSSVTSVECPPADNYTPETPDLQINFSEPLDGMRTLIFKVEANSGGGYAEQPSVAVMAAAGALNAVVPTSCDFPMRVPCGEYTGVHSTTFRISLTSEIGYEPEFDEYYYLTAYRYCSGGGWNPDPNPPGGFPGGL